MAKARRGDTDMAMTAKQTLQKAEQDSLNGASKIDDHKEIPSRKYRQGVLNEPNKVVPRPVA